MSPDIHKTNLLGAVFSLITLGLCILVFVFRMAGLPAVERWMGILFMATALPYIYLLLTAGALQRPALFYVQVLAILLFLLIELFLDYILEIDFRNIRWMTVLYVTFFFAGTGGLIGIASLAGKRWGAVAIVLFLLMTILAFWQRAKTGM